jgi:hypothetical protein
MKPRRYLLVLCSAVLFIVAIYFLNPRPSYANPPRNVQLDYDIKNQKLKVTITHPSMFPSFHYVRTIEIKKGEQAPSVNEYDKQPDQDTYSYEYSVPASAGETITVTTRCSVYGSRTASLTVAEAK